MDNLIGRKAEVPTLVEREDTDKEVGTGSLLIYSTACMSAIIEGAACDAVADAFSGDRTTVSVSMHLDIVSATPVGLQIQAIAEVTEVENDVITFAVSVQDEAGLVATGTHKRMVVHAQRFLDKTYQKL